MKRLLTLLLAAALVAALFAGCSGGQGGGDSSAGTGDAGAGGAGDADAPAGDGPQYGGKFTYAMFYVTPTFFTPASTTNNVKMFVSPAIEQLARENRDGSIEPFLAESMESDPDELTLTVKLREGIRFHDGSELNAEVLKWNLDYALEAGKGNMLGHPTEVRRLDDYTVQLQYAEWSVSWPSYMTSVLVYSKQAFDDHGADWCAVNMVGTGPFVMDSYAVDDRVVWSKNEDYWQPGLPYLDAVELHWIYDTNSSASALMNAEIDHFDTSVSTAIAMMQSAGFDTTSENLTANCTFGFALPNSADPDSPLSSLEVRKALLCGVDWTGVANASTGGYGYWTNQVGNQDAYNYDPALQDTAYDLDAALEMLSAAGYPDGFETTVWTITNNATNQAAATAIQAELGKMGIRAALELVDTSVITEMRTGESREGIIVLGHALERDMTGTLNQLYSPTGTMNAGLIDFPDEYVAALEAANTAATMEERARHLQDACRILTYDHVMMIPAFYMPKFQFSQSYVHDSGMNEVNAFQWTPERLYLDR